MERKRPQLSLEELHQLRWLLGGTLALFAVWTVFYLEVEALWVVALTTAGVGAALVWPALPARAPTWAHRLAFPVIVGLFAFDLWSGGQALPAMIRLALLLILYRGVSYRARRDDLQIILLGLFLVVVAGVLTVSLAFAVQIVGFTACALAFLFVITLSEAAQGGAVPRLVRPNVQPSWAAHVDWRRLLRRVHEVTDWRLVVLGAGLFAGLVVVSGLLFLAIPRFQLENSLFLERFISKKARTGFSENIRFGDVTDIIQDDSLVLNIDVSEPTEAPATLYLRMLVLDEYVPEGGFRLSARLRRAEFYSEFTKFQLQGAGRRRLNPAHWTFYFEPGVSRFLPNPGAFELLRFRETQNLRFSRDLQVVMLRTEPATMTPYRVENPAPSAVLPDDDFAERLNEPSGGDPVSRITLELPLGEADRAELERMVESITAGGKPPALDFARRAGEWLARHHAYALRSRVPVGFGDPLVRWMESDVPGHCEFFAGSFVLLARAAGHPARLVVGFKGGAWNVFSNNISIRNSDAHAWVEIWNGENAWVRVDPTPGALSLVGDPEQTGEAALERRMDRSWSARVESLRVFWYRRIVNFDQRNQLEALRALRTATEATGRRLRAALDRGMQSLQAWFLGPWDAPRLRGWLGAAGVVAAALALWRRYGLAWWWRVRRGRRGNGFDPVRREAGRWLRRIYMRTSSIAHPGGPGSARAAADAEVGPPPQTVRELKSACIVEGHAVRAELERLRYGPRGAWPDPLPVFRRARQAARERRGSRQP